MTPPAAGAAAGARTPQRRWFHLATVLVVILAAAVASSRSLGRRAVAPATWPPIERRAAYDASFLWGTATAAYQVEGAWREDNRSESIWDTFCRRPGKVARGESGDVACDFRHRYREDVELMRRAGVQVFRFSISWSRLIPGGVGPVSASAAAYYSSLVDALLAAGIALDDRYGCALGGAEFARDFAAYARAAFTLLGDRVTLWSTFNEPWTFCMLGYAWGIHAPGRCSDRAACPAGNSSTEPWLCGHGVLLAHAAAARELRALVPDGKVSMNLNLDWSEPFSNSSADAAAAERNMEFMAGWFADPAYRGDYPASMRARLGPALPRFSPDEAAALRGSLDYFALNHYTSRYVRDDTKGASPQGAVPVIERDGVPIGPAADSEWLLVVPWGFRRVLGWLTERYGRPPVWVTESGMDVAGEDKAGAEQAVQDGPRVAYFRDYLAQLEAAVAGGTDLRGYLAWSLLDNFEWADGYSKRFGLVRVEYGAGLARLPKRSLAFLGEYFAARVPPKP
eukprot:tig00022075_g23644.t1